MSVWHVARRTPQISQEDGFRDKSYARIEPPDRLCSGISTKRLSTWKTTVIFSFSFPKKIFYYYYYYCTTPSPRSSSRKWTAVSIRLDPRALVQSLRRDISSRRRARSGAPHNAIITIIIIRTIKRIYKRSGKGRKTIIKKFRMFYARVQPCTYAYDLYVGGGRAGRYSFPFARECVVYLISCPTETDPHSIGTIRVN